MTSDANQFRPGQRVKVLPPRSKNSPRDGWTGQTMRITEIDGTDALLDDKIWMCLARLQKIDQGRMPEAVSASER